MGFLIIQKPIWRKLTDRSKAHNTDLVNVFCFYKVSIFESWSPINFLLFNSCTLLDLKYRGIRIWNSYQHFVIISVFNAWMINGILITKRIVCINLFNSTFFFMIISICVLLYLYKSRIWIIQYKIDVYSPHTWVLNNTIENPND